MEKIQIDIDKIQQKLSRMDDNFWTKITERGAVLSEESARLTAEIKDVFIKLAVTQMNIIEAKRKGYQRLVESKKKSAIDAIISENIQRLDELVQEKSQAVTTLSTLLSELTAIIREVQTIGEDGKNG